MSVLVRRLAFGCFWSGVFWIALLTIGQGIAGSMAGGRSAPASGTVQQGHGEAVRGLEAGIPFRERYGLHVVVASVALAAAGTVTGLLPGTRRK